MQNQNFFDVLCGECGRKMNMSEAYEAYSFVCENCNIQRDGDFLEGFFAEKYRDKIKKIEITNINSAKIYFK